LTSLTQRSVDGRIKDPISQKRGGVFVFNQIRKKGSNPSGEFMPIHTDANHFTLEMILGPIIINHTDFLGFLNFYPVEID
jgi:hypothetical protein